jgi:2-polyprenyl-3-methyl-5-hydroxy-6-metoxy-1,4-benzoquinol methylase
MPTTDQRDYTIRLLQQGTRWKRALDVQHPYRRHLQELQLGLVLDVGCGIGRNLSHLAGHGGGIGVDHNAHSVAVAQSQGLLAFTPDAFRASSHAIARDFDSILLSHVVEHLQRGDAIALLIAYLDYLRPGGRVVLLTPQEAGYNSDETHVTFVDFPAAAALLEDCGVRVSKQYSFPLPRALGRLFKYNEFVTIGEKSA